MESGPGGSQSPQCDFPAGTWASRSGTAEATLCREQQTRSRECGLLDATRRSPSGSRMHPRAPTPCQRCPVLKERWSTPGVVVKKVPCALLAVRSRVAGSAPNQAGPSGVTRPDNQGEGRLQGLPALGPWKDTEESDPWVNWKLLHRILSNLAGLSPQRDFLALSLDHLSGIP